MNESYERGVFNGNILVAKYNKIIYQNEFGYSDASKSIKLNPNNSNAKAMIKKIHEK